MTLIKTSVLNAFAVIIKMLTLLGLNKILAIYVGPVGYATLGQFQNAIQMITVLSSGAINNGVVKYTSEHEGDIVKQHAVWRTAGMVVLFCSLLSSAAIILFSKPLAQNLLSDGELASVFIWLGASLVFFVFNSLFLAILNGKREIAKYVICNISGSIFSLIVTSLLAIFYGLYGALVALAIYQSLSFFVSLLVIVNTTWFKISYLFGSIDKTAAKGLFKYTAMAATSAVCSPVAQMLIRDHIGNNLGWDNAGYWEAMWRLSSAYLLLVSSTLGIYYLPKLSALKDRASIRREIVAGYKFILPIAIFSSLLVFSLKDTVIIILFTESFLPMKELFFWQLIGDILKITSLLLGYLLLAKALTKEYIVSEVFFALFFYSLVSYLTNKFGLEGAPIAYCINYFFHFIVMACILRRKGII